jgi:hypothetical protein
MSPSRQLKHVFSGLLLLFFLCVWNVHPAEAQATFGVGSSAAVLNSLGYTELLGPVSFFVANGTTKAGTIEFFIPNIGFTDVSGVTLVGSGGLTTASIAAIVPSAGIVDITVPAGAGPGSSLTLSGIRISAVGATFTTLNAAISATGNSILATQNSVQVVRSVTNGVLISNTANSTLTIASNVIVESPGTFVVGEGFLGSFTSAIGAAGQTAKTQVVFQVTGLPDGIVLTFPSPLASDTGTGATLVISGAPDLSNQSASNRVVYDYNATALSTGILDQFSITPMVGITGTVGSGNSLIQVALGPIGAAVPNAQYPSTAIPRYMEAFVPSAPTAPPPPVIVSNLAFPVPAGIDSDSFTISNTDNGAATVTAVARAEDGSMTTGISNQASLNLPAGQTTSVSLTSLFGNNATPANVAAVEFGASNHIVGNSIATAAGNRVAIPGPVAALSTYLPFDAKTSADVPSLSMENTGNSDSSAQIVLYSSLGAPLGTANRTVKAHGVVRENLGSLFSAGSLPLSGYFTIQSSNPVRTALLSNRTSQPEEISPLAPLNSIAMYPFFAFGSGYNTVATVINSSTSLSALVSLNAFTPAGVALTVQPITRTLAPGERQTLDFGSLFGGAGGVTVGYFSAASQSATNTLFGATPNVYGMVRISAGSFSTSVPLAADSGTQFYLTPTTETSTAYTGLALVNTSPSAITVTLELISSTGTSVGTTTVNLAANNSAVKLLRELIPASLSHDNGRLRISSTGNLKVLGFRGTFDLKELLLLRGETTTP